MQNAVSIGFALWVGGTLLGVSACLVIAADRLVMRWVRTLKPCVPVVQWNVENSPAR